MINRIKVFLTHTFYMVLGLVGVTLLGYISYLTSFLYPLLGSDFINVHTYVRVVAGFILLCLIVCVSFIVYLFGKFLLSLIYRMRIKMLEAKKIYVTDWVRELNHPEGSVILTAILLNDGLIPLLTGLHPRLDEFVRLSLSKEFKKEGQDEEGQDEEHDFYF